MWYGQLIEGRRSDIAIVDDRTRLDEHLGDVVDVIEANIDTRPVYLIRLDPAEVEGLTTATPSRQSAVPVICSV